MEVCNSSTLINGSVLSEHNLIEAAGKEVLCTQVPEIPQVHAESAPQMEWIMHFAPAIKIVDSPWFPAQTRCALVRIREGYLGAVGANAMYGNIKLCTVIIKLQSVV